MRVTIIPDDQMVGVDGEFVVCDVDLPGIHAVQWDSEARRGEIEFKNPRLANQVITDFADFEDYLAARDAAIQAMAEAQVARDTAVTNIDRRREYPSIEAQLEALYDARQGNTTKLQAIDAEIAAVKARYPIDAQGGGR